MWSFKQIVLFMHRWLGLITGLVVFVVSVTGCIYVFQHEINNWRFADMRYVDPPASAETLPLSTLEQKAEQAMGPSAPPFYNIITYKDPTKAWRFLVYEGKPDAVTYFGSIAEYRSVYLNPYTGAVTGHLNNKYEFFNLVKYLHWSLLLSTDYGQPIVGWSTFVFVILLVTGLVLWWPARWSKRLIRRNFTLKWNATWRRINYDLHNVIGFYATLAALILALTGMVWSFGWFKSTVYAVGAGSTERPAPMVNASDTTQSGSRERALNTAFAYAWNHIPEAERFSVGLPSENDEAGVIRISGYDGKETYYRRDALVFDQYSGQLLDRKDYEETNGGERLIAMNYDIHVGSIGGLPGKMLAFLASLVCASLPLTGFIVWFDRESKKWSRHQQFDDAENGQTREAKPLPASVALELEKKSKQES